MTKLQQGDPLSRPQASFAKRQREQAKREKRALKAEKKAQRQTESATGIDSEFEQPQYFTDEETAPAAEEE